MDFQHLTKKGNGVKLILLSCLLASTLSQAIPLYHDVRLVNGVTSREGRVEIFYNYQWGTICDESFGWDAANVLCLQLGYNGVSNYHFKYGQGHGPILRSLSCYGYESDWKDCSPEGWNTTSCSHSEDVGVKCTYDATERHRSAFGLVVSAIIIMLIAICCCSICPAMIKKSKQPRSSATAAGTHQLVPHQTNQMAAMQPLPTSGQTTQTAVGDNPPAYREVMSSPMKYPPPGTQSNPAYPPQNYPQGPTATQPAFAPYPTQQAPVSYPAQSAPYPQQSNLVSYPQYAQVSSVTPSAPPMVSQ